MFRIHYRKDFSTPVIDAAAADVLVTPKLFEAMLAADKNLVALHTSNAPLAMTQLRQLAMRSGQSIYQWEADIGLVSMRDATVRVPSTQRMGDALRHIQRSLHFGVYVFVDVERELQPAHGLLLRSISESRGPAARKLVFLGASFKPPTELIEAVEYMRCQGSRHVDLRLRDGRWTN